MTDDDHTSPDQLTPAKPKAPARRRRKSSPPATPEERRALQRQVCHDLLERWVPLATSEAFAIAKETRGKTVIEDEPVDTGLKAGAFVLKVLERIARLDGLDAAEKRELTVTETADPVELARRVEAVSPILAQRLQLASVPSDSSPVND